MKWATFLEALVSVQLITACNAANLLGKQDRSDLRGAPGPRTITSTRTDGSQGAKVVIPSGSLAIGDNLSIEEGASVANDVSAAALGIPQSVTPAGPSVNINSSTAIDDAQVGRLEMAIPYDQSTALVDDTSQIVVFYRVKKKDGTLLVGVIPNQSLHFEGGLVYFNPAGLGNYQAARLPSPVETAKAIVTVVPVVTKANAETFPPVSFSGLSLSLDQTSKSLTLSATVSPTEIDVKACVAHLDADQTLPWDVLSSLTEQPSVTVKVTESLARTIYAELVCQDEYGRTVQSGWSNGVTMPVGLLTRVVACQGLPSGGQWVGDGNIAQAWNWKEWLPSPAAICDSPGTKACGYKCKSGFLRASDRCIEFSYGKVGPDYWPAYKRALEQTTSQVIAANSPPTMSTISLDDACASAGYAYSGAVVGPNGHIFFIPFAATCLVEFDPSAETVTYHKNASINSLWAGGVLSPGGKIIAIPHNATKVLEFDPVSGTMDFFGAFSADSYKWSGGVVGPDGLIYATPQNAPNVLVIDPANKTTSTFGSFTGTNQWQGGVLAPNGKIYAVPFDATRILKIDPATRTTSLIGPSYPAGGAKWMASVLAPDGKIFGIPYSSRSVLVIDTNNDQVTTIALPATASVWKNGVLGPDGLIYALPESSTDLLTVDPKAQSASLVTLPQAMGSWGVALGLDGKIYGIKFGGGATLNVMDPGFSDHFPTPISLSTYWNHF